MQRIAFIAFVFWSASALAAGTEQIQATGFKADSALAVGEFDAVNIYNGNLTVTVPIGPVYKTNGLVRYQLTLHYQTNFWDFIEYSTASSPIGVKTPEAFNPILWADPPATGGFAGSEPRPEGVAGVGWYLGLGDLIEGQGSERFPGGAYRDETGAIHAFGEFMHVRSDNVSSAESYTHDGSYLRKRRIDSKTQEIDFPDGTRKRFSCVDQCGNWDAVWVLDWISDPLGYVLRIERSPAVKPPASGEWVWTLTEGRLQGGTMRYFAAADPLVDDRKHVLRFDVVNGWQTRLTSASMASPAGRDATATYLMTYDQKEILRPPVVPWLGGGLKVPYISNNQANNRRTSVSLLQSVTLPADAGKWKFEYTLGGETGDTTFTRIAGQGQNIQQPVSRMGGQIKKVQAPTGGGYEYKYSVRGYHVFKCGANVVQTLQSTFVLGVSERTRINGAGARDESAKWVYAGRASALSPSAGTCAPFGREYIGSVLDPDGALTLSFFDHVIGSPTYGAPFAPDLTDTTVGGMTRYRSSAIYDVSASLSTFQGNLGDAVRRMFPRYDLGGEERTTGKLLRERYVVYDYSDKKCLDDPGPACEQYNLRVSSQHTRFYDDANACQYVEATRNTTAQCANGVIDTTKKVYSETRFSEFDGLGHYRAAATKANFLISSDPNLAEEARFEYTHYNPNVSYVPASTATDRLQGAPAPAAPWLLGTYTYTTAWENNRKATADETSKLVHARYRFDAQTGVLTATRRVTTTRPTPAMEADLTKIIPLTERDVAVTYDRTIQGNKLEVREQYFGGDDRSLAAVEWPASTTPSQYEIISRTQFGSLQSTEFVCDTNRLATFTATIDPGSGLATSSKSSNGAATGYVYDALGRLIRITPPGNERAHAITYTLATGATSTQNSVSAVRMLDATNADPNAPAATYTYDDIGRLLKEVRQTSGGDATTDYKYFPDGTLEWMTVPYGTGIPARKTFHEYDVLNRVTRKTLPDDTSTTAPTHITARYDSTRQVYTTNDRVARTGGTGNANLTEKFDAQGRLTEVNDEITHAAYGYDASNHLTTVALNGIGSSVRQIRRMERDGRGVLVSEEHPELQTELDPARPKMTIKYGDVDARGHARIVEYVKSGVSDEAARLELQYDRAERLIHVWQGKGNSGERPPLIKEYEFYPTDCTVPNAPCTGAEQNQLRYARRKNFIFDPAASAVPMTVMVEQEYHYYAGTGRTQSVRTTSRDESTSPYSLNVTGTVGYIYDLLGNPNQLQYPVMYDAPARSIDRTYHRGQLKRVTQAGVGDLAVLDYRANGAVSKVSFLSNAYDTIESDVLARTVSILWNYIRVNGQPGGTKVGEILYDGRGSVSYVARGGEDDQFTYDAAGRLATARVAGIDQAFAYDAFANLTSIATGSDSRSLPVLNTNRLGTGYAYNNRGDLKQTPDLKMEYDALGAMTKVDAAKFGRFFVYSADDERVGVIEYRGPSGVKEQWSFRDGPRVIRDVERINGGSWKWTKDYVYRGSTLNSTYTVTPGGVVRRDVHVDHLGTVALLTNSAGKKVDNERAYFPFGTPQVETPLLERFAFTGHERDLGYDTSSPDQDLDYMHARYYSAAIGRFLSLDPVGGNPREPQSWNRYAYVSNNPTSRIDADGRFAQHLRSKTYDRSTNRFKEAIDARPCIAEKLPTDPGGLPDRWTRDPSHTNPHGDLFRDPEGNVLEWHKGRPGEKGWKKRDHWHYRPGGKGGDDHLRPGTEIPDRTTPTANPTEAPAEFDVTSFVKEYGPNIAVGVGIGIIVGTIAEDILTGGVGILDDPITLGAGWALIQTGIH
ncbi:MAG TPA: RHS repeat-associated core domain-containing protein [Thermoanaerobaculia bacterium]|nr:RHS repeat-associated core domain-containing protein [Thermoanaerobaculia bacterium]